MLLAVKTKYIYSQLLPLAPHSSLIAYSSIPGLFWKALGNFFNDDRILKVLRDLNRHVRALAALVGLDKSWKTTLDAQLAMESTTGNPSFMEML